MGSVKWGTDSLQDESRGRMLLYSPPTQNVKYACHDKRDALYHFVSIFLLRFRSSMEVNRVENRGRRFDSVSHCIRPLPPPNDCDRSFGTRTPSSSLSLSLSLNAPLHSLLPPSLSDLLAHDFEARLRFALAE